MTIKIAFNTLIFIFVSQRAELEISVRVDRSITFVSVSVCEKENSLIVLYSIQINISTFPCKDHLS